MSDNGSGILVVLLVCLPFLSLLAAASIVAMLSAGQPTVASNTEEWSIMEDPETGEIKIIVHRRVKRGVAVGEG